MDCKWEQHHFLNDVGWSVFDDLRNQRHYITYAFNLLLFHKFCKSVKFEWTHVLYEKNRKGLLFSFSHHLGLRGGQLWMKSEDLQCGRQRVCFLTQKPSALCWRLCLRVGLNGLTHIRWGNMQCLQCSGFVEGGAGCWLSIVFIPLWNQQSIKEVLQRAALIHSRIRGVFSCRFIMIVFFSLALALSLTSTTQTWMHIWAT